MQLRHSYLPKWVVTIFLVIGLGQVVNAQVNPRFYRIARLVIDSAKLDSYKAALKEHAEAAVKVEAGVLMLYAVYDKLRPTQVTVFEIYADMGAYDAHIKTSHFLKYKTTVQDMVTSLELIDVTPIAIEAKSGVLFKMK